MERPLADFQPFSVRRGAREPFRLVEGVPEHSRKLLDTWIEQTIYGRSSDHWGTVMTLANLLRAKPTEHVESLINDVSMDDDRYLDLIQTLLETGMTDHLELERILSQGGSIWRVADTWKHLEERVPQEARDTYSKALSVQEHAAGLLSDAWRNAFGLDPDAKDAWHDAVRALEAVLHPIVSPKDGSATLTKMIGDIRSAPADRFVIRAPGDVPRDTLLAMLATVPYEEGRHGSDPRKASLETARVVVLQATAIIAAVGQGIIERA